jgi:hypothetical protein
VAYPNHRHILFVILISLYSARSQTIPDGGVVLIPAKKLDVSKSDSRQARALSLALTKELTTDTEKFKALFSWVAHNISYNYGAYFAPGGTYSNVQSILRHRSAICVGYAELMDSLCAYAGIPNVSVYGYAKDHLSDVHDSLYIDNHAWNAVKLDGEWHVYDVTWTNGVPEYTLNRWNRRKSKMLAKTTVKYKLKRVRGGGRLFKSECNEYVSPAFFQKQTLGNKIKLWFLSFFKLRYKFTYAKKLSTDFYLSQPEVFAITHFPDDSTWALSPGYSMKRFENDSAFYFLSDTVYQQQERRGTECPACDEYYYASDYRRLQILKEKSALSNPKNQFVLSLCNYKLAEMYVSLCDSTADTLQSRIYLDSALYLYALTGNELRSSKVNIVREFKQLIKKNTFKKNGLLADNMKHRQFVAGKMRITLENKIAFQRLNNRSRTLIKTYRRKRRNLSHMNAREPKKPPINNSRIIEGLESKIVKNEALISFIQIQKDSLIAIYNKEIQDVSLNLWASVVKHDTVIKPYIKCIIFRQQLKDDYKKLIVDQRTQLFFIESLYGIMLRSGVYDPTNRVRLNFSKITKLIDQKNALQVECVKLKQALVKQAALGLDEFSKYKQDFVTERVPDYCWLENYLPYVVANQKGFKELRYQQKKLLGYVLFENHIERKRFYWVNKEYLRRDRKHKNIVDHNKTLTRKRLSVALKKKKRFKKR